MSNTKTSINQIADVIDAKNLTSGIFIADILPKSRPIILKNLVCNWPATASCRSSPRDLISYLNSFQSDEIVPVSVAEPALSGRLFYNDELSDVNFKRHRITFSTALRLLSESLGNAGANTIAIQSVRTDKALRRFSHDNQLTILPDHVAGRLWIGNRVTVAAHYDSAENIACVVAGRRRFTLFPPEQVTNLYPGPFELTPAGPIVSMVDFDAPDHARYPGFRQAMEASITADLEPGDAIYIPYLWWHHVRSLDPLNMLVNYWWKPEVATSGEPLDAMLHAMLAIKNLPEKHRDAWAEMFNHYVFARNGTPGLHLAKEYRGIQGTLPSDAMQLMRAKLAAALQSGSNKTG